MSHHASRISNLLLAAAVLTAILAPPGAGRIAAQEPVEPVPAGDAPAVVPGETPPAGEPGPAAAAADASPSEQGSEAEGEGAVDATAEGAAPETPLEDLAADYYLSRCAGCHTIGEGFLSGPDLAPSTEWPAPDLLKAVKRMEKNVGPMTDEQVASLVELLKDEQVKARLSAARERQVTEMAATLEPASPAVGEELFHGARTFRARGVACSACHRAGERGGNLAADLTKAASRLGEQAVIAAAENPGFPLMRAAYAAHPVSRQEAVHLAAYLAEVDAESVEPPRGAAAGARPIGWWGGGAAFLFLAAMVVLYRGRNRGVRALLVRRASQR